MVLNTSPTPDKKKNKPAMRKHIQQYNLMNMEAGNTIQYFTRLGKGVETNWLWAVTPDCSVLIGWDWHYPRKIEIYSVNICDGKADFSTKDFTEASPELVNDILTTRNDMIKEFSSALKAA